MNKTIAILFVLLIVLLAAYIYLEKRESGQAPAPAADKGKQTEQHAREPGLKAALILPGTTNDNSWNQSAYEQFSALCKTMGVFFSFQENVKDKDVEGVIRDYAHQGFHIIFCESFNYGDAALAVAKEFPDTFFAVATHFKTAENVAVYDWPAHQGGYLAGYLAALLSTSRKIGFVGGYEVPDIIRIARGYEAGAKAAVKDVDVMIVYTGSWDDAVKGRESAESLLDMQCDVIAQGADGPGVAALKAAAKRGKYAIGYVADQNVFAPQWVVTSVVLRKTVAYKRILQDVMDNRFTGKAYMFDMLAGGVDLAPIRNCPADVVQRVQEMKEKILAKEIDVPEIVK